MASKASRKSPLTYTSTRLRMCRGNLPSIRTGERGCLKRRRGRACTHGLLRAPAPRMEPWRQPDSASAQGCTRRPRPDPRRHRKYLSALGVSGRADCRYPRRYPHAATAPLGRNTTSRHAVTP
jgi:hypothetical protein